MEFLTVNDQNIPYMEQVSATGQYLECLLYTIYLQLSSCQYLLENHLGETMNTKIKVKLIEWLRGEDLIREESNRGSLEVIGQSSAKSLPDWS